MAKYQTIEKIRKLRDDIKEEIKTLDLKKFKDQTFGPENEYSYRGLIGGIESLLTDLSTLTQHENKFIKLSDYQERVNISTDLTNILHYIETPNNLYAYVDTLKIKIRNYNVRNFSENLIQFEKEIDDIRKVKLELQEILQESEALKEEIVEKNDSIGTLQIEIQDNLNSAKEKIEEITTELESLSEKSTEQNELNTQLDSIKTKASDLFDEIVEFKTDSESNQKLIDAFATKVQERETKLVELEERTSTNTQKLKEYEEERQTVLKEANQLIESAKQALNYKTAEGLSDAFNIQHMNASKWWISASWITGAALCLIGTLWLGIWIMQNIQGQWYMIMGRILLLPIPIAGAVFCANQYTKQKNIIEDYAYKLTVAKALVGFSEQLKKNGNKEDQKEYADYVQKALAEIHKDPLRSRKEANSIGFKSSQLDQVVELAKKIVDISKSSN